MWPRFAAQETAAPAAAGPAPVVLRRELDLAALEVDDPCAASSALGSFWPNHGHCLETQIVKTFKECCPVEAYQPHIAGLCRFYCDLVTDAVAGERFDWILRVLSSSETQPADDRPQSLLVELLCRRVRARPATDLFFRSSARPPMRAIARLSGPDTFAERAAYLVQDLFLRPRELGGSVLLVDDIGNVGASMRIYAQALKQFAGVKRVVAVNLAATRFREGRDGRGMLKLDLDRLPGDAAFAQVWTDSLRVFHSSIACPRIGHRAETGLRFAAERTAQPCLECVGQPAKRRWWGFGR